MNNLQLEVLRRRNQRELVKMIELDINSPQETNSESTKAFTNSFNAPVDIHSPEQSEENGQKCYNRAVQRASPLGTPKDTIQKQRLELEDTEHANLKRGTLSNGRKYSVRTDRKRFFFPPEWKLFWDNLQNDNQRRCFDILLNTGARNKECRNIKKEDIDFNRGTLTIKVAKIKAKKGERFPVPRTFKVSSQFLERLKGYTEHLKDEDKIPFLTNSALNLALKRILEKVGIKDKHMFSVHNLRKTNGNWLKACGISGDDIVDRLGHDHETFRKSYSSATIFDKNDRIMIKEILGDIIDYYLDVKKEILGDLIG